jgi:hypothetical protein
LGWNWCSAWRIGGSPATQVSVRRPFSGRIASELRLHCVELRFRVAGGQRAPFVAPSTLIRPSRLSSRRRVWT